MQYRTMPHKNDKLSILGFGCMRFPSTPDNHIEEELSLAMLRHAFQNGINYFDTAWPYHYGESELLLGKFIKECDRSKLRIATKLPSWLIKTPEDCENYLNQQLERLQTDYIDYYLLHSMNSGFLKNLSANGVFQFLDEMKKKGKIRYSGFSFHDKYPIFKKVIDSYTWDFCQIQLNFFDTTYQAGVKGMKYAASKGMGVIVMEPLRGGKLVNNIPAEVQTEWRKSAFDRSPVDRALRWIWNNPETTLLLSGMSSMEQLQENLHIADTCNANELSTTELNLYKKVRKIYLGKIPLPCTGCRYCMPCPHNVDIPSCFGVYMDAHMFSDKEQHLKEYNWFVGEENKADKCVNCGECVPKCPQHIHIPEELLKVAKFFK
jgi:uncharacterized protein